MANTKPNLEYCRRWSTIEFRHENRFVEIASKQHTILIKQSTLTGDGWPSFKLTLITRHRCEMMFPFNQISRWTDLDVKWNVDVLPFDGSTTGFNYHHRNQKSDANKEQENEREKNRSRHTTHSKIKWIELNGNQTEGKQYTKLGQKQQPANRLRWLRNSIKYFFLFFVFFF